MNNILKFAGGIAIAIGIHLTVSSPASGVGISSFRPPLSNHASNVDTHSVEVGDMSKLTRHLTTSGAKMSSHEPPVEGGPQSSQGSGTR